MRIADPWRAAAPLHTRHYARPPGIAIPRGSTTGAGAVRAQSAMALPRRPRPHWQLPGCPAGSGCLQFAKSAVHERKASVTVS